MLTRMLGLVAMGSLGLAAPASAQTSFIFIPSSLTTRDFGIQCTVGALKACASVSVVFEVGTYTYQVHPNTNEFATVPWTSVDT